jgi:ribosome-binding protein aMBF1 (putative translation factor)
LTIANDFQRIVENGRTNSGLYKLKLEEMIKEKKKKEKITEEKGWRVCGKSIKKRSTVSKDE